MLHAAIMAVSARVYYLYFNIHQNPILIMKALVMGLLFLLAQLQSTSQSGQSTLNLKA